MWRVYKHTGKDTDYGAYKEALNAATNEVRKSKRNFEHKLAQNIKSDSKSSVLPRIEKGHGAAWGKRALLFAKLHFKGTFARVIIF